MLEKKKIEEVEVVEVQNQTVESGASAAASVAVDLNETTVGVEVLKELGTADAPAECEEIDVSLRSGVMERWRHHMRE